MLSLVISLMMGLPRDEFSFGGDFVTKAELKVAVKEVVSTEINNLDELINKKIDAAIKAKVQVPSASNPPRYTQEIINMATRQNVDVLVGKNVDAAALQVRAIKEGKLWCMSDSAEFKDGVTELSPVNGVLSFKPKRVIREIQSSCANGECGIQSGWSNGGGWIIRGNSGSCPTCR